MTSWHEKPTAYEVLGVPENASALGCEVEIQIESRVLHADG